MKMKKFLVSAIFIVVFILLAHVEYNLVELAKQMKLQSERQTNLEMKLGGVLGDLEKVSGQIADLKKNIESTEDTLSKISIRIEFLEKKLLPPGETKERVFKAPQMKHGLDTSVMRYAGKERYDLAASRFSGLQSLPLEEGWRKEDGLWLKIDGSEIGEEAGPIIVAQGDGQDNNANALTLPDNMTNYTFSVDFKLVDRDTSDAYSKFHTNYIGLYLRYQDANNFVRVDSCEAYRPAGYQLIRLLIRENGNFRSIKNIPIETFYPESLFQGWHHLSVQDNGEKVIVLLDNKEILNADYTTTVPSGHKGLQTNIATRALFKNITLKSEP